MKKAIYVLLIILMYIVFKLLATKYSDINQHLQSLFEQFMPTAQVKQVRFNVPLESETVSSKLTTPIQQHDLQNELHAPQQNQNAELIAPQEDPHGELTAAQLDPHDELTDPQQMLFVSNVQPADIQQQSPDIISVSDDENDTNYQNDTTNYDNVDTETIVNFLELENTAQNVTTNSTRPRCFFDITINGKPGGRIIMELFNDIVPMTTDNFYKLCLTHYRNSIFHRVVPQFVIQGGDYVMGNGTGGYSIYGATFPDESFQIKHTCAGLLSMANKGTNTNGSQFFITLQATPSLDGKHVVFGRVVSGMDVVNAIQSTPITANNVPIHQCKIINSGSIGQSNDVQPFAPQM